ncbi:MAG: hypothetical protein HYZ69_02915, partial [Candidatus Colwellbacteria bacterium]|nr:hypothetical protein [Candidatus Colwellbacteria bacterium]
MQSYLVEKLVELTREDAMVWRDVSMPGFTHNFIQNNTPGYSFRTEWLQDGSPQLFANQILVVEGEEVAELIRIIHQQQER